MPVFDSGRDGTAGELGHQTLDPEDKIWAARDVCFGKDPSAETGTAGVPPTPDSSSESASSEASAVNSENSEPATQSSDLPASGLTHYDTLKHDNSTSPLPIHINCEGGAK